MVESYKNLLKNIQNVPILMWAIPSDEFLHPCATDVSAVLIKELSNNKTHCISFNHPDLVPIVNKKVFIEDLNTFSEYKWVFDKKSFIQLLPITNLLDVNLWNHLQNDFIIDKSSVDTSAHRFIYRTKRNSGDLNNVVPLLKHKEVFEKMCELFFNGWKEGIVDGGYEKENSVVIETLSELESNGIYVNEECFNKHFSSVKIQPNGLVYSQYNIYTSTGRPSNHFDGVNYAALNKDNGVRKCFTSRYGDDGMMVLIDYSAFHPRIISRLAGFDISVEKDIYKYLGEMYFDRPINEYDLGEIKNLTMKQLYGGVEEKYKHIKYLTEAEKFIKSNWEFFIKNNYVLTPVFGRKITINDANPGKVFNYILQATETEIALTAVKAVNQYLKDKKTKAVLYTYDSLLFDFYKDDGKETLSDVARIMTMNNQFPIKIYIGESYDSIIQIYP
jgi:hypothetical protein